MFNVGGPEVMIILLVALVVLGPQQLPKAIRSVSNVMNELRKVSSGFQNEVQKMMDVGPTDTTGREVHTDNSASQPSPGPGSGAASDPNPSTGRTATREPGTVPEISAPEPEHAAIDPADRAAG